MKTKRTQGEKVFFILTVSAVLMLAVPVFSFAKPIMNSRIGPGEEEPAKKTKMTKSKALSYRNNVSVKIYSDPFKRMMHVIAKANKNKSIDFFLFDMEGTLLRNYKLKAKERIKIQGLKKGSYIYRVFSGDEETASGNFEIR